MLTAAFSSLWMPAFLHLGWIHVFTLVTLVSLPGRLLGDLVWKGCWNC
jgi:hypothetical protein